MSDLPTDDARRALALELAQIADRVERSRCGLGVNERHVIDLGLTVAENLPTILASLRAKTAGGAEDQFWIELREPRRVPERKGPWPHRMLAKTLREFMEARPTAYISVVTLHHYGPDFQDGPEALMMADGRSTSTGLKHIHRCRAAHGTNALPLDPSPQSEGGGE